MTDSPNVPVLCGRDLPEPMSEDDLAQNRYTMAALDRKRENLSRAIAPTVVDELSRNAQPLK